MAEAAYDFHQCKLCREHAASPRYFLSKATVYACSRCDFHYIDFLDDLSRSADDAGGNLDARAWDYIETRLRGNASHALRRLNLIREHASIPGSACLDIGAGAGDFAALLATEGSAVSGVEPSPLRRRFALRRFGLELRGETVEELSRRNAFTGRFDIVTLWDVIEHVNFPAEVLGAAALMLRPGGILFLDTPSRDALSYRVSEAAYRLSGGRAPLFLDTFYSTLPFGHKQIFRPQQLVHLAQACGLEPLSLRSRYAPETGLFTSFHPRNQIVLVCRRPG